MNEISGVYEIVNDFNGHRYIGSAVNISARWRLHKHHLNNNKHHSAYLQRAWNKYGEVLFSFNVLQTVIEKDERITIEQKLIDELNPEYNLCKVAGTRLGTKWTNESKKKASNSRMGYQHPQEVLLKISNSNIGRISFWRGKTRPDSTKQKTSNSLIKFWINGISASGKTVNQFTKQGDFIQSFISMGKASQVTGVARPHISRCCLNKRPTAGGFVWRYAKIG